MSGKRKKWIFVFLASFCGVIIFFAVRKIAENLKLREMTISFQTDCSDQFLQEIITGSLERMRERWHAAKGVVILDEDIMMNERGEIQRIWIELLDANYIYYTIDAWQGENANQAEVLVCRKSESDVGAQVWKQGIPVEKNAQLLDYLEEGYDCKGSYWVQYSGRGSDKAESALMNLDRVYSGEDGNGIYYCFCFVSPVGEGKWESNQAFLVLEGKADF